MGPTSVILIDEMILPSTNVHWQQAQLDISMMAGLAAVERNDREWRELLAEAGLAIRRVWRYGGELGDSVMVVGVV